MKMGEFANTGRKEFEIIEFEAKPYNQAYTRANWNALILYNFISEMYHYDVLDDKYEGYDSIDECIDKLGKKIYHHYENKKGIQNLELIKDSVRDIKAYAKALNLDAEITRQNNFKTMMDFYHYNMCYYQKFNQYGYFYINDAPLYWLNGKKFGEARLTITINDGKIDSYKIGPDAEIELNDKLELVKINSKVDIFSPQHASLVFYTAIEPYVLTLKKISEKLKTLHDSVVDLAYEQDKLDEAKQKLFDSEKDIKEYTELYQETYEDAKEIINELYNKLTSLYEFAVNNEGNDEAMQPLTKELKEQLQNSKITKDNIQDINDIYCFTTEISVERYKARLADHLYGPRDDITEFDDVLMDLQDVRDYINDNLQ